MGATQASASKGWDASQASTMRFFVWLGSCTCSWECLSVISNRVPPGVAANYSTSRLAI